ncbi:AP-3 complex subunit delta [Caenorhabditis elegans]|uniref:AP-3 complex subunit delta n=2 Tax=Caenorhabditis elegans TaxID=6239 RepID=O16637_CAEEL|nr:AP-3 complex subunit delta [Caenorhabditis elegans]CCD73656.1 AP-3 complex subunit delta [Caenorhabditis elegans]|eukprot:NP_494570.1 AP-3 complex subunit delta [Caenorhabditis elegans]
MALRKVRSNIDRIFDKSLTDLIRGIRNNKDNESRYITQCMEEIKQELRQDSIYVKANAIEKLAYLQMLGYDISWASFNVIEVMASTKYTEKRIGYLAAAQSFHDETDVLMLTTNLIRKDVNSSNMYESGIALGGLSCFVTPDLARDLAADVVNLLSCSRNYTRKRAVLLLYKIFLKYPDALRPTFPRLKEKLEDPDPGVQSSAVNVICELARKNPKNYLTLAPVFFKLMTTSSNNWMLIKIIKLFGALVPLEPRLGKKLLEPLTNLINSTSAMSLLYECINTVIAVLISISAGGDHTASIQLCVQKLGVLIEDSDQNLKYLGLLAMGKILKTHPKAVQAHKDIVLRCLDDKDESIRIRSLDLLYGMVSKKNIVEIVKKLMEHVEAAEGSHYRDELLSRIIGICSWSNYQYITNFEWYISVLVELTKVEGTEHGAKIAEQIQDVTVRVESIRHFSVSQMALLVENAHVLLAGSAQQRSNMCEVLLAAAWICGEYSQHVRNQQGVLESMLKAKPSVMPGHILSVYVQNIGKLYCSLMSQAEEEDDWDAIDSLDNLMLSKLPQFELSEHLEAQERACNLMAIIRIVEKLHQDRQKMGSEVQKLYDGELNPVATKAQRKVPVPDGLDLDAWIGEEWAAASEDESDDESDIEEMFGAPATRPKMLENEEQEPVVQDLEELGGGKKKKGKNGAEIAMSKEEIEKRRKLREQEIENNPYYVKGSATAPKRPTRFGNPLERVEIVEKEKEIQSPLEIPGVVGLHRYMEQQDSTLSWKKAKEDDIIGGGKKKKSTKKDGKKNGKKSGKKRRTTSTSSEEEDRIVHKVNRNDGEMPEGAKSTDDEDEKITSIDEFRALDMDLDAPLRPDEIVKAPQAYTRVYPSQQKQGPLVPRPPTTFEPRLVAQQQEPAVKLVKEKKKKTGKKTTTATAVAKLKKKKSLPESSASKSNLFNMDDWLDGSNGNVPIDSTLEMKSTLNVEKPKKLKKSAISSKKKVREAYEETSGVCTPSIPHQPSPIDSEAATSSEYCRLAANKTIYVDFVARPNCDPLDHGRLTVHLRVSRKEHKEKIRKIELNMVDTLNAKVLKESEDPILLAEELDSDATSSEASFDVQVTATNVSRTMRGTLTYFLVDDEGTRDDKLDLRLPIPATVFVMPNSSIRKDDYSALLASDDVDFGATQNVATGEVKLKTVLTQIVRKAHFSIVEETPKAASLFGRTVGGEPICLLVKKTSDGVQIDGKAGDEQLIQSIIQDVSEICARA